MDILDSLAWLPQKSEDLTNEILMHGLGDKYTHSQAVIL